MDPNEALRKMRAAIEELRSVETFDGDSPADAAVAALVENAEALDDWMTQGGFPPSAWRST